jgi:hypothetical protein
VHAMNFTDESGLMPGGSAEKDDFMAPPLF